MHEVAGVKRTLDYWFGALTDEGLPVNDRYPLWFGKDAGVDEEIRQRFGAQFAAASAGQLDHWGDEPLGMLALIVTLDQFPRNMFRDSPRAFATDPLALRLASDGVDSGADRALAWIQRAFVYMPLEHAEDFSEQERSVRCFEALAACAPASASMLADTFLDYARQHRDIIDRFGRFPHRNSVLGRTSTPEERAFLQRPGSSF